MRSAFVAAAAIVALGQLLAVTLEALPPNRYSEATQSQTSYLNPFFTQNWRLFAPNPVSEDRTVRFQGAYLAADGSTKHTPWIDWTEVELDLIHHKLVGGRGGYVTNKLFSPLVSRFSALTTTQREASTVGSETDPPSWAELRDAMEAAGPRPGRVIVYLRYERATTRLATDVLMARWPDRDFTAVRYTMRRQRVVPYEDRSGSDAERAAARPAVEDRASGWRTPDPGDAAERRVIADFDRRHR